MSTECVKVRNIGRIYMLDTLTELLPEYREKLHDSWNQGFAARKACVHPARIFLESGNRPSGITMARLSRRDTGRAVQGSGRPNLGMGECREERGS